MTEADFLASHKMGIGSDKLHWILERTVTDGSCDWRGTGQFHEEQQQQTGAEACLSQTQRMNAKNNGKETKSTESLDAARAFWF
jgi:hypothetical protein